MATPDCTASQTYCIYRIVCFPTGKVYVGQTNNSRRRKKDHFRYLKRGQHHSSYMQAAYNKYGRRAFWFEVLETDLSIEQANQREIYWIEVFDSFYNGFNATSGGDNREFVSKPCTWNGTNYESLTEAAKANNITVTAMRNRLLSSYKCDQDLVRTRPDLAKECIWNGIKYPSISAAAKASGIPLTSFKRLLKTVKD